MNQHDRWKSFNGESHRFGEVENKLSSRADLHAMIMLDKPFPSSRDMIGYASHDEVFLNIEPDEIESLTDDQIIELTRCGVRHDSESDSLAMFT